MRNKLLAGVAAVVVAFGTMKTECEASVIEKTYGGFVLAPPFTLCNSCFEFLRTGTACLSLQCPQSPGGRYCGPYSEFNLFNVMSIWSASIGLPGGERMESQGLSFFGGVMVIAILNDTSTGGSAFALYFVDTCGLLQGESCCR